jgi:hypothetical protein
MIAKQVGFIFGAAGGRAVPPHAARAQAMANVARRATLEKRSEIDDFIGRSPAP